MVVKNKWTKHQARALESPVLPSKEHVEVTSPQRLVHRSAQISLETEEGSVVLPPPLHSLLRAAPVCFCYGLNCASPCFPVQVC